MLKNSVWLLSGLIVAALSPSAAQAQSWPTRPIHFVVPFAAGGTTDLLARLYAEHMSRALGTQVLVENRPGASANLGSEYVARAAPDGYTLLMATSLIVSNPASGPVPSFDPLKAFAPVSLLASVPYVLAAHPGFGARTVPELVARAKAQPGQLTVASAQLDLPVELLRLRSGADINHVPYKGGALAVNDAIGGHVNMVLALVPVLLPHLNAGTLKPLAVAAERRSAALAHVPTFAEQGVRGYDQLTWYGVVAPGGTPDDIVQRLARESARVMTLPEVQTRMIAVGMDPWTTTPGEYAAIMKRDLAAWARLVDETRKKP